MLEIIPSPKELFGLTSAPPSEHYGLQQSLSDYIMHVTRVVIVNPEQDGEVLFSQRDNGICQEAKWNWVSLAIWQERMKPNRKLGWIYH